MGGDRSATAPISNMATRYLVRALAMAGMFPPQHFDFSTCYAGVALPGPQRRSINQLSRRRRVRHVVFLKFGLCRVSIHNRLLKLGLERRSIQPGAIQVDTINLAGVADVF